MLFILGIITCLLGAILAALVLLYQKLDRLTIVANGQQALDYQTAAMTPKSRPSRAAIFASKPKQTESKGRGVKDQATIVDLSEVPTDAGIAALEEFAGGENGA